MPRRVDRGRAPRGPVRRGPAPTAWCSTATTSPTRSWPRRWPSGWAGSWSTPSTRSTASSVWSPRSGRIEPGPMRRRRPKVLARITPGRGGPHPRVRPDRPGRLQVRVRAGRPGRRLGPSTACSALDAAGIGRVRRDPRPPREPGVRPGPLRPGHRGAGRVLRSARPPRAGGRRGPRRGLRQRRGGPAHGPVGRVGAPGLPARRASPTRSGSPPSRAGPSWPRPASPSTGWGRSRTFPATGPTSRWTAG